MVPTLPRENKEIKGMTMKKMNRIMQWVGCIAACVAIMMILYVTILMILSPSIWEWQIKSGGPKDRATIHREIYGN